MPIWLKKILRCLPVVSAYVIHRKLERVEATTRASLEQIAAMLHTIEAGHGALRASTTSAIATMLQTIEETIEVRHETLRMSTTSAIAEILPQIAEWLREHEEIIKNSIASESQKVDTIRLAIDARFTELENATLPVLRQHVLEGILVANRVLANTERLPEAIDCYYRLISYGMNNRWLYSYLAEALVETGQLRRAAEAIGTALRIDIELKARLTASASVTANGLNGAHARSLNGQASPIVVATSLMPRRVMAQLTAVRSWQQLGLNVISVNAAAEIDYLRPLFPDVKFCEANLRTEDYVNGRPLVRIADVVEALEAANVPLVGIVNSDIVFEKSTTLIDNIRALSTGSLCFGNRIDVDHNGSQIGRSFSGGYDYFFFERANADGFKSVKLVMGMPWWDFWMPMAAHVTGLRLIKLANHRALHFSHGLGYNDNLFMEFGHRFIGEISTLAARQEGGGSELSTFTYSLFSALGKALEKADDGRLPEETIGRLCFFSNFLIDHLSTSMDVASGELHDAHSSRQGGERATEAAAFRAERVTAYETGRAHAGRA